MNSDGSNVYRQAWHFTMDTTDFLKSNIRGKCLEVCSGESRIGDITLDIDASLNPDIKGDMRDLDKLVEPGAFGTVLWDAPFNFYYKLDEFTRTLKKIASIATDRIIVVGSNMFAPGLLGWKRTLYWGAHEANTRIRLIWIYDRIDSRLPSLV